MVSVFLFSHCGRLLSVSDVVLSDLRPLSFTIQLVYTVVPCVLNKAANKGLK